MRILHDVIPAERLRDMPCGMCGQTRCDDDMHLHAKCHPRAGTWVVYVRASHVLIVTCRKCDASVVTIQLPVLQ